MLRGVDPAISPDLLHILAQMGHGDELVIADRNFPSYRVGQRVLDARGYDAPQMVAAVCSLLPLDVAVDQPVLRMATTEGPDDIPPVHADGIAAVQGHLAPEQSVGTIERFSFYDRAAEAFAVVVTGEQRPFGDFVLVKGVL